MLRSDAGVYVCNAWNKHGTAKAFVHFNVLCKYKVVRKVISFFADRGTCEKPLQFRLIFFIYLEEIAGVFHR